MSRSREELDRCRVRAFFARRRNPILTTDFRPTEIIKAQRVGNIADPLPPRARSWLAEAERRTALWQGLVAATAQLWWEPIVLDTKRPPVPDTGYSCPEADRDRLTLIRTVDGRRCTVRHQDGTYWLEIGVLDPLVVPLDPAWGRSIAVLPPAEREPVGQYPVRMLPINGIDSGLAREHRRGDERRYEVRGTS